MNSRNKQCTVLALLLCVAAAAAQAPAQQAAQELRQALSLAQQGRVPQALAQTEDLLKRHPGYAPALKLEGMLLEEAGRSDEAATAYERGLRAAPDDSDLLYKVGVHELVTGR